MESFLSKVSTEIASQYDDPKNLCIVLPSRRAGTFLRQELAKAYNKTIEAPRITTLDEFTIEISGLKPLDKTSCFFELYHCYIQLFEDSKQSPDTLEEFLNWAPNLLTDYSEIDNYMVNTLSFFSYINDIRALETWNTNGEPLTEHQKNYIALWKRIGKLYHLFKKKLLENNQAYSGLLFRHTAENIPDYLKDIKYEQVIFAGFNAFTTAEKTITSHLIKNKKAKIFWDSDNYYFLNPNQEAGNFLRQIKSEWKNIDFSWSHDFFKTSSKKINIYNCNTNYAQSILTAQILEAAPTPDSPDDQQELKTALVLNKEDILLPMLNALPNKVQAANITMGYEMKLTPLASFVKILLDLWFSKDNKKDKKAFYYKNVLQIIEHSYFEVLVQDKKAILNLKRSIIKRNIIYVTQKFIQDFLPPNKVNELIFLSETQNLKNNTTKILEVLSLLKNTFGDNNINEIENVQKFDKSLHIEFIYHYTLVFRKLLKLMEKFPVIQSSSLKLYRKLIGQLVNKEKIPFFGEPLKGIQIMGMLETRALDFEHVILTSVNEGILPAGKKNNSFIPYDVKREFGLPTYSEHDAVFANHFYRLIQRAKNIDIIYYTGSDDFGAGTEKSRFIEQIIHELPKYNSNIEITTHEYNPTIQLDNAEKTIVKNPALLSAIENRLSRGLSPSALNNLITCPLDYYYKYILGLGEQDEIEESIKASTLGTCIHNTLENLHAKNLGIELTKEHIKTYKTASKPLLEKEFLNFFSEKDLKSGTNLLSYEVAKTYISKYLDFEKALIQKESYTVHKVEQDIDHTLSISVNGKSLNVKIHGKIDSVCELNGETMILDYKTGNVSSTDLSFKHVDDLEKKGKALQLLCYTWLYYQKHPDITSITPCIYSFRNGKEGFLKLKYDKKVISKEAVLELFPQVIEKVITQLFDLELPLAHETKSKYCEYCI